MAAAGTVAGVAATAALGGVPVERTLHDVQRPLIKDGSAQARSAAAAGA